MLSISSYTDIRYGKIKNIVLAVSALFAIPIQIWEFIYCDISALLFGVNFVGVALFSSLLYIWGYWAAGDVKLLMAIALIFPYTLYWNLDMKGFKGLSLILVFISVTYVFVIIDTIINAMTNINTLMLTLRKIVTRNVITSFLKQWFVVVAIANFLNYINGTFLGWSYAYIALIIFFIVMIIGNYLGRTKYLWVFAFGGDIVYWMFTHNQVSFVIFGLLITTAIFGFGKAVQVFNYKIIDVNKIKPGMIISVLSINKIQKLSGTTKLEEKKSESMVSRIDVEEVEIVKQSGIDKVRIVRKIPFALFVSIATVLYIGVRVFYAVNYK